MADYAHYLAPVTPMQLRDTITSAGVDHRLAAVNFGDSKGQDFDHVIILPTDPMRRWLAAYSIASLAHASYIQEELSNPSRGIMAARPHYPSAQARSADLFVHLLGLGLAIVGGGILLWMGIQDPAPGKLAVIAIYSLGAVCMFGFSTAYNFAPAEWKPILRRLDHVGIFLMIAATYTPFTAYLLSGAWAWSLTTSLWVLAGLGIVGKIFLPPISQKIWVPIYLGLAWIGAIAAVPLADITSEVVLWLLALGGIFYSAGVLFYTNKRLQFAKAIWHGHVVAAAATHWAAVLVGLFLVRS